MNGNNAAQTIGETTAAALAEKDRPTATVYLVGAGPGDPGLLTLKAKELLETADEVVYDYLASDAVVRFANPAAKKIFVGKKGFSNHVTQDEINQCLVDEALASPGARIVRLKGGDPFVFGRGGEEALELRAHAVPFAVVPGITAGVAACAYAGIPVTHRGLSSSVTLITGHETPDKLESAINWAAFGSDTGTLCFYMGVRDLPHIVERLMANGRAADTPVALVRWGTTPEQEVVSGTLETIVEVVERAQFKAPAIIVVGDAVRLRDALEWFEARPLFGRSVVVTRARAQASGFAQRLSALGARVIEFPTIEAVPRAMNDAIEAAIGRLADFDWVVFTSANGVSAFFSDLEASGRDARAFGRARVCAIGPATASALKARGIAADVVPPRFVAESVAETLIGEGVGEGSRVLVPRAAVARDALVALLTKAGAQVEVLPVYDTVIPAEDSQAQAVVRELQEGTVDAVTFTSSSTVRNFASLLSERVGKDEVKRLMEPVACASIGPVTSNTLEIEGLPVATEAREYTVEGLTEALVELFGAAQD